MSSVEGFPSKVLCCLVNLITVWNFNEKLEFPQSDRLYLVVDAILDALTSQTPRDRYVVGSDAWFGIAMVSWLPTFVVDSIIRKLLKTALPKVVRID